MPMKRPGSVSKTSTPSSAATRRQEVGPRGDAEDAPGAARVEAVELDERADVDELDQRRDHDRGERRLRQLLEQAGEEEQRDDRQHGDDEAGQLRAARRAEPLTAVFERLPLTTMPLESPAPRFAAPRPISSRFASIS